MAPLLRQLILRSTVAVFAAAWLEGNVSAGEKPAGAPPQRPMIRPPGAGLSGNGHPPDMQHVRRALEAMTPEQRKQFGENMMRWSKLSPAEKQALRERDAMRQKFVEQEVTAVIAASGLKLEGERRAQFVKRFIEERGKIEEQLRREAMEKRKPMIRDLVGRLKLEFADPKP